MAVDPRSTQLFTLALPHLVDSRDTRLRILRLLLLYRIFIILYLSYERALIYFTTVPVPPLPRPQRYQHRQPVLALARSTLLKREIPVSQSPSPRASLPSSSFLITVYKSTVPTSPRVEIYILKASIPRVLCKKKILIRVLLKRIKSPPSNSAPIIPGSMAAATTSTVPSVPRSVWTSPGINTTSPLQLLHPLQLPPRRLFLFRPTPLAIAQRHAASTTPSKTRRTAILLSRSSLSPEKTSLFSTQAWVRSTPPFSTHP